MALMKLKHYLTRRVINILQAGAVHSASLKEIEQADAVLILGEDIWNTAPMMALAVRQSVMKTAAARCIATCIITCMA